MKMFAIGALIALAGAVAVVLIIASTKPDTFRVQRSIVINAKPAIIAAQIIDMRKWKAWSPYEKKDPAMTRIFSGAGAGKGAVYKWKGNSNIGEGSMEIADVSPARIVIKLDFLKPMEAHNIAEFTFVREGAATRVTWEMHGPNNFMGKIIHVFINMDKMVGNDFAAGLAGLKEIVEK